MCICAEKEGTVGDIDERERERRGRRKRRRRERLTKIICQVNGSRNGKEISVSEQ